MPRRMFSASAVATLAAAALPAVAPSGPAGHEGTPRALFEPATAAAATPRAEMELAFGTRERSAVTDVRFAVVYRGANAQGKPSPIRGGTIEAPAGTRFGGGAAIPACTASADEIRARGRDACPPRSKLGQGFLTAITGFGPPVDPYRGDLHVYKTPDGFVEIVQHPGTNTTVGMDRPTIEGSRITLHPPRTPGGPPDGETAVNEVRFTIAANGFVVTPPDCPADGLWRTRATFTFADGYTAAAAATTPCRRAAPASTRARPAMRLAVTPTRARTGRIVTYRFRVTSPLARCRAGATIRFAHRRVRTDRAGRATVRRRARMPGVRTARASKRGCGTSRARVRVV